MESEAQDPAWEVGGKGQKRGSASQSMGDWAEPPSTGAQVDVFAFRGKVAQRWSLQPPNRLSCVWVPCLPRPLTLFSLALPLARLSSAQRAARSPHGAALTLESF